MPSPIEVAPLPEGVSLKSIIKDLKRKVYHLKKRLKKTEDELQRFRKNTSKVMIEVTHLRKLLMRDSTDFTIRKGSF